MMYFEFVLDGAVCRFFPYDEGEWAGVICPVPNEGDDRIPAALDEPVIYRRNERSRAGRILSAPSDLNEGTRKEDMQWIIETLFRLGPDTLEEYQILVTEDTSRMCRALEHIQWRHWAKFEFTPNEEEGDEDLALVPLLIGGGTIRGFVLRICDYNKIRVGVELSSLLPCRSDGKPRFRLVEEGWDRRSQRIADVYLSAAAAFLLEVSGVGVRHVD